jgi:hypothetical protein
MCCTIDSPNLTQVAGCVCRQQQVLEQVKAMGVRPPIPKSPRAELAAAVKNLKRLGQVTLVYRRRESALDRQTDRQVGTKD